MKGDDDEQRWYHGRPPADLSEEDCARLVRLAYNRNGNISPTAVDYKELNMPYSREQIQRYSGWSKSKENAGMMDSSNGSMNPDTRELIHKIRNQG